MAQHTTHEVPHQLRIRRLGIDTHQEPVIYMRRDCEVCRSEGFEAQARVFVRVDDRAVIATLNVVSDGMLEHGEAGLSESAWKRLDANEGDIVTLSHPPPVESLSAVRSKVYGQRLEAPSLAAIVRDIAEGRYADVHIAAFVTACASGRLDREEIIGLTRAMIDAGEHLRWSRAPVVDKHCVGGLPGNRTTLLVVPIITACGLTMPKTSSRAITSPAGTADTMEVVAPVNLSLSDMRRVVEREGGCIVWGGAVHLSPADDVLIRVERALDIDSEGQLIASVLSKKAAAGSTHVVIDIPTGATAKVRSRDMAEALRDDMVAVGRAVGLEVLALISDGSQPVGRGIGPALEARDMLAVLRGEPGAPQDLRDRALQLAGMLLELAGSSAEGMGLALARTVLESGKALAKFTAICEAQGAFHEPPTAVHRHEIRAARAGRVSEIDNRRLARVAKLAGAPDAKAAGVDFHAPLGTRVEADEPLYTIHAETPGELAYALDYAATHDDIVLVEEAV